MNFHGFLFWIRNRKENKETGTICMKLRIPSKKPENNYGIIDEGLMEVMLDNGL